MLVEFYNYYILPQLTTKIGLVFKVDSHTLYGDIDKYTRVYVQIDHNQPLIKTIFVGKFQQAMMYEGLNKVCFAYGKMGHQKWNCPYI